MNIDMNGLKPRNKISAWDMGPTSKTSRSTLLMECSQLVFFFFFSFFVYYSVVDTVDVNARHMCGPTDGKWTNELVAQRLSPPLIKEIRVRASAEITVIVHRRECKKHVWSEPMESETCVFLCLLDLKCLFVSLLTQNNPINCTAIVHGNCT